MGHWIPQTGMALPKLSHSTLGIKLRTAGVEMKYYLDVRYPCKCSNHHNSYLAWPFLWRNNALMEDLSHLQNSEIGLEDVVDVGMTATVR